MTVAFDTDHDVVYGAVDQLSPLIRRVTANNPSKFTFRGTGTYIVGTGDHVAIIDPGPRDDDHVAALLAAVEGEHVTHVLITHTHGDHSPAAAAVVAATGATTYGFGPHPPDAVSEADHAAPDTDEAPLDPDEAARRAEQTEKERPDTEFVPDEVVGDGDRISGAGWSIECVHTPGHISNHLCFALTEESALFSGDHVMGWSTTIIPPPDGDMAAYLDSLRLVAHRAERVYYPTHGAAITDPVPYVESLLAHRLHREQQILDQLSLGPATIPDMVAVLYADVPEVLHQPAARSVRAHLVQLVAEERIGSDAGEATADATYSRR